MTERRGLFSFLLDVNPVAKLYKKILGVSDLIALDLAKRESGTSIASQNYSEETRSVEPPPAKPQTTPRYSSEDHARRYGDYDAARQMEKARRMNHKND